MSSRLYSCFELMPKRTLFVFRSATIDRCSTHGRVARARRTWLGQENQVMPGTFRTTVATMGWAGRSGPEGSSLTPQPITATTSGKAETILSRIYVTFPDRARALDR